jgi:hypothetical protein
MRKWIFHLSITNADPSPFLRSCRMMFTISTMEFFFTPLNFHNFDEIMTHLDTVPSTG